jgi:site-specific recombinase XerD
MGSGMRKKRNPKSHRRVIANGFLPIHVTTDRSQHGTPRLKFQKKGMKSGYFKARFGTEEFEEEYRAFLYPGDAKPEPKPQRALPGTLDEALNRYMEPITRLGPSAVTQGKIKAVLEDFRQGDEISGYRGTRMLRGITFETIDKIIEKKKVKSGIGNKTKGGVTAAQKLRKELIRFFDFAIKAELCDRNPVRLAEMVKLTVEERIQKKKGFTAWTEDDIDSFRARWALGTKQRLAMELVLWTDQRRSDVHAMGRNQIVGGRIPVIQEKGGEELWIAVAPQLLEAIVSMKPEDTSPFCFIISRKGTAYTKESFGNWFKETCVAAGLLEHNAHGLRKATLRRLAELEAANKTMKALSGQKKDDTLAIYTASADQVRLADSAVTMLARWEMSSRECGGRGEYRFTAND